MLHLSQNQVEGTLQATSGTRTAHIANNPNAIPVAVMYAPIEFLLTVTGSGMAGRQPPSLLAISASCTAISWCRAHSMPVSVFSRSDVVQTHFSHDPPNGGQTAVQGGMRMNATNASPSRSL